MCKKNVIQFICMSSFVLILFVSIMVYKVGLDEYFEQLDELNEFCKCRFRTIQRIVNGQIKKFDFIPWQVSIAKMDHHICMGLILNQYHILSAQHCFFNNSNNLNVRVGLFELFDPEKERKTYLVKQIYRFPNFKFSNSLFGDLAILKLSSPIQFENELIEPVCLDLESESNFSINQIQNITTESNRTRKFYTVSGFGTKEPVYSQNNRLISHIVPSLILKTANLTENFELFKSDPRLLPLFELYFVLDPIDKNSNQNPCHGDSGGGLNFKRDDGLVVVKGISSTSMPIKVNETTTQFCKSQSLYSRLSHPEYKSFINQIIGDLSCRPDYIRPVD